MLTRGINSLPNLGNLLDQRERERERLPIRKRTPTESTLQHAHLIVFINESKKIKKLITKNKACNLDWILHFPNSPALRKPTATDGRIHRPSPRHSGQTAALTLQLRGGKTVTELISPFNTINLFFFGYTFFKKRKTEK